MSVQTLDPVGVAIVGAGQIGRYRLEQLSLSPRFRVAGVHDMRPEAGADLDRLVPTSVLNRTWRSVLDDPGISTIWLATPPGTHAMLALDALNSGKHILVEPPLCLTLREASEIGRTARLRERHVLSTARIGVSPDVVAAVETRLSGESVRTATFISQRFHPTGDDHSTLKTWRRDPASGGGVLWQQGRRIIEDLCGIIGSEPRGVFATLDRSRTSAGSPTDAGFAMIVDFQCGAQGRVLVSRGSLVPLETGWMVEFETTACSSTSRYQVADDGELIEIPVTPASAAASMDLVLRRLSDCARVLQTPPASDTDWRLMQRTVAIILAAQESAASGTVAAVTI